MNIININKDKDKLIKTIKLKKTNKDKDKETKSKSKLKKKTEENPSKIKKKKNKKESLPVNINNKPSSNQENNNIHPIYNSNSCISKIPIDKFDENLFSLQSQLENSCQILNNQDEISKRLLLLNKEITINDVKLEKFIVKTESEDYYNIINRYSSSLEEVILKFKGQIKEIQSSKHIKEESNKLKTQLELMEMKIKEEKAVYETKILNFRSYLSMEFNSLAEYLNEIDGVFINKFSINTVDDHSISLFFQNLKDLIREIMKKQMISKEEIEFFQKNNKEYENKLNHSKYEYDCLLKELNDYKYMVSKDSSLNYNNNIKERIYDPFLFNKENEARNIINKEVFSQLNYNYNDSLNKNHNLNENYSFIKEKAIQEEKLKEKEKEAKDYKDYKLNQNDNHNHNYNKYDKYDKFHFDEMKYKRYNDYNSPNILNEDIRINSNYSYS